MVAPRPRDLLHAALLAARRELVKRPGRPRWPRHGHELIAVALDEALAREPAVGLRGGGAEVEVALADGADLLAGPGDGVLRREGRSSRGPQHALCGRNRSAGDSVDGAALGGGVDVEEGGVDADERGDLDDCEDDAEDGGEGPEGNEGGGGGEAGHELLGRGVFADAEVAGNVAAVVGLEEEAALDDAEEGGEDEPVGGEEGADEEDHVGVAVAGEVRGQAGMEDVLGVGEAEVGGVEEVRDGRVGEGELEGGGGHGGAIGGCGSSRTAAGEV